MVEEEVTLARHDFAFGSMFDFEVVAFKPRVFGAADEREVMSSVDGGGVVDHDGV